MLSSPSFAPTRPSGDSTNAPATTAFVGSAIATAVSCAVAGIPVFSGSSVPGLVPGSSGGTANFLRADAAWATPPDNSVILQVGQARYTTNAALTVAIPFDDTTPLSSEGTEVLSLAITPRDNTNQILTSVHAWGTLDNVVTFASIAVFRGTTCINAAAMGNYGSATEDRAEVSGTLMTLDSPASTAAQTYSVRVGSGSSIVQMTLNGIIGARRFGGASACTLTLMEVSA